LRYLISSALTLGDLEKFSLKFFKKYLKELGVEGETILELTVSAREKIDNFIIFH